MGIAAIPNFSAVTFAAGRSSANTPAAQTLPATANDTVDTVQLTEAERVYALYIKGQKISQIAATLNLSTEQVDSYFTIVHLTQQTDGVQNEEP